MPDSQIADIRNIAGRFRVPMPLKPLGLVGAFFVERLLPHAARGAPALDKEGRFRT